MTINRPPIYDFESPNSTSVNPQPAPGVPTSPTPSVTTSGTGTSPGTGSRVTSNPGGAPPPKNYKSALQIKSFLLRPSLTSHFQCWFNPPKKVRDITNYNGNADFYSISCTEASLPGSSIITNEVNDDYTGVTERLGYRRQYDNTVDFTFYVDASTLNGGYNVINFFEAWMRYAMGETSTAADGNYNYRVRYPDGDGKPDSTDTGYRTEIFINKFERDFNGNYLNYTFVKAYPVSVASMPVSYDSSQLLKCTVSFTFNRYILASRAYAPESEPTPSTPPGVPKKPEYYGPGLPGEQANELRRGLLEDFIVRQQNNPLF